MIVGVDEAGRGPLAGVVTACALYLNKKLPFKVGDSKKISKNKREEIFNWLSGNTIFSVAIARVEEIDRHNILEATFLAFDRAIKGVIKKLPKLAKAKFIVDGNIFRTKLDLNYECIKKADESVKEVSCASIVAKVSRDHLMQTADFLYPQWGFCKNKGYPTGEHFVLLDKYPLTPFHRRSFSPCSNAELSK